MLLLQKTKWQIVLLGIACLAVGVIWGIYNNTAKVTASLDNFAADKIIYVNSAGDTIGNTNAQGQGGDKSITKRRVINFWATWCAPCIHEMPVLQEAAQNNDDVYFAGWTLDHEQDVVTAFLRKIQITYDIFMAKSDIFVYFEKNGNKNGLLPYTVLLDENGYIINKKIGEFTNVAEVEEFIRQK